MSNAAKKLKQIPLKVVDGNGTDTLYAAHQKVFPREVQGRFQRLRKLAVFALLGLFYLLPWLSWDDRQAVLFDLPARKFYIFGLTFWPQDFLYLAILLILAAFALFFFTALAGRMWCGYACPQTVWTEVFIWMEQWTEGNRAKRMKLDASPWTREKILRKGAKQFFWITFSLWTGITFVGYFTPMQTLLGDIAAFEVGGWAAFWALFYGFATYGNAGFLREQVCMYMCPYARFQSAMFDKDTLIIAYDETRGEPRGGRKRGVDPKQEGLGDCIDCTLCVQVCPTGIDIRDGLQYECIACGACIDACDSVMDKMNYPKGLIRYSTDNAMAGKASRVLRPRILIYGALLLIISAAALASLMLREPLAMNVIHNRQPLYRVLDSGELENAYLLRVMNRDDQAHMYAVEVEGLPGLEIETEPTRISVEAGGVITVPARVRVGREALQGLAGRDIHFVLKTVDGSEQSRREQSRFLGPAGRSA